MFDDDIKNYHAWDYKFWLAITLDKVDREIEESEQRIFAKSGKFIDCYSCWSFRFNLIRFRYDKWT